MVSLIISSNSHSRLNLDAGCSSFALSQLVRVNKFNRSIYGGFDLAAGGSIPWPLLTTTDSAAVETEESVNLKVKGSAFQAKAQNFAAARSSLETRRQS